MRIALLALGAAYLSGYLGCRATGVLQMKMGGGVERWFSMGLLGPDGVVPAAPRAEPFERRIRIVDRAWVEGGFGEPTWLMRLYAPLCAAEAWCRGDGRIVKPTSE